MGENTPAIWYHVNAVCYDNTPQRMDPVRYRHTRTGFHQILKSGRPYYKCTLQTKVFRRLLTTTTAVGQESYDIIDLTTLLNSYVNLCDTQVVRVRVSTYLTIN